MLNDHDIGKCPTCAMSIFCPTWADRKCIVHERRYVHNGPVDCADYKKRPKDWKEPRCRCEDCLRNGLGEEDEE